MGSQSKDGKEEARVNELISYGILDTPAEVGFDRITKLASTLCQVPVAFISLVDSERQWFKSAVGTHLKETSRDISFCTYAIEQDEIMEVPDATLDARFFSNPLVVNNPKIRYYAGAPIRSPRGHNIGTVCVIDTKPNKLSSEQKFMLKILSEQVMDLLESRHHQRLLVSKAKMQSVGEIVSGVCHQINNPLAIISGRSMILKTQLQEEVLQKGEEIIKEIDLIDKTTTRISNIIRALRLFANKNEGAVAPVEVTELLEDALLLYKNKFVSLSIDLEENLGTPVLVNVDKTQLTYAFLVLLNNSLEAMDTSEEKIIKVEINQRQDWIDITVSDSGMGINPANKERIFDPFFTTKTKNFGLGLAQAKVVVEDAGGEIALDQNKGPTIMRITLPILTP